MIKLMRYFIEELNQLLDTYGATIVRSASKESELVITMVGTRDEIIFDEEIGTSSITFKRYVVKEETNG